MKNRYRKSAGGVILNENNLILLCARKDQPSSWQLPQGGIDEGETPKEAFLREMREEIGTDDFINLKQTISWHRYDIPQDVQDLMFKKYGNYLKGQEQLWFLAKIKNESSINIHTEHPEFIDYKWATPKDVIDHSIDFKKHVYTAVLSEFGLFSL